MEMTLVTLPEWTKAYISLSATYALQHWSAYFVFAPLVTLLTHVLMSESYTNLAFMNICFNNKCSDLYC